MKAVELSFDKKEIGAVEMSIMSAYNNGNRDGSSTKVIECALLKVRTLIRTTVFFFLQWCSIIVMFLSYPS